MPEHVTTFGGGPSPDRPRLNALTERFGGQVGEVRSTDERDAAVVFDKLVAAKDRYPISRVTRHVCRHDEGIGSCTVDQEG